MSGGHFNYNQFTIGDIADDIQEILDRQGKEKDGDDLVCTDDKFYTKYPDEVQKRFKEAVGFLRIAKIYTHRIDWYLSGDDGESSFLERLISDISDLHKESK